MRSMRCIADWAVSTGRSSPQMARYFVFESAAEGNRKGLELLSTQTATRRWPRFQCSAYVFQRTADFEGPILPDDWRRAWERAGIIVPFTRVTTTRIRQLVGSPGAG